MGVGWRQAKFGSKNRFTGPAVIVGQRFKVPCAVAVKEMNGIGWRGKGRFQKRSVCPCFLNAPWRIHDDQICFIQPYLITTDAGVSELRTAAVLFVNGPHVFFENGHCVLVRFNKQHVLGAQKKRTNAQNAVASAKVRDNFPFYAVELVDGQQPISGKIAFRSVLLHRHLSTRMGGQP